MPSIPKSCSLTWYSSNTRKNASTVQSEETTYHFGGSGRFSEQDDICQCRCAEKEDDRVTGKENWTD